MEHMRRMTVIVLGATAQVCCSDPGR